MKRTHIAAIVALAAAALATVASCARTEPEDMDALEKLAFDAWMAKYHDEAVEQPDGGIYVEFVADGDQSVESSRDTTVWLTLDYTATDIAGNVFATRDSTVALRQRTYTPATHYNPDLMFVGEGNYGMVEGQYFALRNDLVKPDGSTMKMSAGSHVKLYIPSYLAYGSHGFSDKQGYGGQFALGGGKIIIEDLKVREVIPEPAKREERLVVERAAEWGMAETDSLAYFMYVDSVSNFAQRAGLAELYPNLAWNKKTQLLTADSTATIRFVGKFLDGFIFDTNVESVREKFYYRRAGENYKPEEKTLTAFSFKPSADEGKAIPAFGKVIPKLRRGLWYRVLFTSVYGYAATGLSARALQEQAYYDAYSSYMFNAMYYDNMYGGRYGSGGYYDDYYGGYGGYNPYMNQSLSSGADEEEQIVTEIQPFTPLIFEIYIEP
ncbi:MAG: hypothetical protein LBV18_03310 [Alistipes sp.]|jgi:hypothetical protein|nr:hypothetical protein [Alistipes sp.]